MSENSISLTVGGEVKAVGLAVGGKLFVFTPNQQQFLLNLQKMKNVTAAALSVDKTEEWGKKFLASQKFKKYLNLKMKAFSDRNGMDVDWWYQFGKNLTDGSREFYVIRCEPKPPTNELVENTEKNPSLGCGYVGEMDSYSAESFRNDDMELRIECPACFAVVTYELVIQKFEPTREQVEGWKELGSRLLPKVERTHHTFENVDIVFENQGGQ